MKTIEERAPLTEKIFEQKAIDDAEIRELKSLLEKKSQIG